MLFVDKYFIFTNNFSIFYKKFIMGIFSFITNLFGGKESTTTQSPIEQEATVQLYDTFILKVKSKRPSTIDGTIRRIRLIINKDELNTVQQECVLSNDFNLITNKELVYKTSENNEDNYIPIIKGENHILNNENIQVKEDEEFFMFVVDLVVKSEQFDTKDNKLGVSKESLFSFSLSIPKI